MSLKRLLPLVVFACLLAGGVASDASAGGIRDWEPCPDSGGDLVCPMGTVGVPYTIKFRAVEEPPCQPGEDVWVIDNGSPPPGLSLATDGTLSGTPTQAGTYPFWVEMQLPDNDHCNGTADTTQERFVIGINPGTLPAPVPPKPKLVIGPEQSGVRNATVGAPYTLPMTANLPDAKTWTINAGSLPPGLVLGSSDGVIAGTPTTAGSYTFTVLATIDERSDTKTLSIVVREPLVISAPERFDARRRAMAEVGVFFDEVVTVVGGTGSYTWTVTGALPDGLEFDAVTGSLSGEPELAGSYRFGLVAIDTEGRRAVYPGRIVVVERVEILTKRLPNGRVGKIYRTKLQKTGGVAPLRWKIKRGPLPKGIRFDPFTGVFAGLPAKAGVWVITVELMDGLRVKALRTVIVAIAPASQTR